jgi:hypothetical protein
MKKKNNSLSGSTDNKSSLYQKSPLKKQLLPERAEEYLREGGNIEDMPSPEQMKEAEKEYKYRRK